MTLLVELGDNLPRRGDLVEQRLAGAAPAAFLLEDRLAEVDTLAADINVARAFHQGADVAVALAAEKNKRRSSWWYRLRGVRR